MRAIRLEVLGEDGEVVTRTTAEVGDLVLDACDEARAGVPFGCRNATCGSCVVEVVAGGEALDAPSPVELSVLRSHATAGTDRLACRAAFAVAGACVQLRPRGGSAR